MKAAFSCMARYDLSIVQFNLNVSIANGANMRLLFTESKHYTF